MQELYRKAQPLQVQIRKKRQRSRSKEDMYPVMWKQMQALSKDWIFNPGVTAARDTFKNAFTDLQATGDLNKDLDEKEFEEKAFPVLDGVPETTTYNVETGKFTQE